MRGRDGSGVDGWHLEDWDNVLVCGGGRRLGGRLSLIQLSRDGGDVAEEPTPTRWEGW